MLSLEIELLTGRYVASSWNDRDAPEWPPHPARVFSAIVAACHEAGGPDALERRALEWLQALPAPAVVASQADTRLTVPVFVPVNDTAMGSGGPRKAQTVARAQRRRQAAITLQDLLARETSNADLSEALDDAIPVIGRKAKQHAERLRDAISRAATNNELDAALKELSKALSKETKDATKAVDDNLKEARAAIPLHRPRKERRFPSVTPHDARVQLIWNDATPDEAIHGALLKLVSRVSYLGHSSSLVRCTLVDDARKPTWVPDDAGAEVLRVPGPDQLAELEAAFALHRGQKPRVLPYRPQRYRHVADDCDEQEAAPSGGCFGADWIVFQQVNGPALPIERAVDVAAALRQALSDFFLGLAHGACDTEQKRKLREELSKLGWNCDCPVPESVSGLTDDKRPLQRPHVAFVALPFVDHAHADGHLMGAAAILPRSIEATERKIALVGLGHVRELKLAPGFVWTVRRLTPALTRPFSLEPARWCRKRSIWATATPILLDRFPGNLASRDPKAALRAEVEAKETIADACERIGLPRPRTLELVALPPFRGVPPAARFRQPVRKTSRPRRVAVHAILDFGTPVQGPVLLGAGRYLGLGLCCPVTERDQ